MHSEASCGLEGISKWYVAFGMTKQWPSCITAHYHKVITHKAITGGIDLL